jgi:hypothetical protein
MESSDTQGSLQKSSTELEEEIKEAFVEIMDLIDQSKDSTSKATVVLQLVMEKLRHLQTLKTMVTQGPVLALKSPGTDPKKMSSSSSTKVHISSEYLRLLEQAIQLAEMAIKEMHRINLSHQRMEEAINKTSAGKIISEMVHQRLTADIKKYGIDAHKPTQYSDDSPRNLLVKEDFERFKEFVTFTLFRFRTHHSDDPAICRRCYEIFYVRRYREELNPTCLVRPKSRKKDPVQKLLIPLRQIFRVYNRVCETTHEEFIDLINYEFLDKDESMLKKDRLIRNFNFKDGANAFGREFVVEKDCKHVLRWPLIHLPGSKRETSRTTHECLKDAEFTAIRKNVIDVDYLPGRPLKAGTLLSPLGGNKDAEELDDFTIANRLRDVSLDIGVTHNIDSILGSPLSIKSRQSAQQAQRIKNYKQDHEESFSVKKEVEEGDGQAIEEPGSSLKEEVVKGKKGKKRDKVIDKPDRKKYVERSDKSVKPEPKSATNKAACRDRERPGHEIPEKGNFRWIDCQWMAEKSSKIRITYETMQKNEFKKRDLRLDTEMILHLGFYVPARNRHFFNGTEEESQENQESQTDLSGFVAPNEEEEEGDSEQDYCPPEIDQADQEESEPAPPKSKPGSPLALEDPEQAAEPTEDNEKPGSPQFRRTYLSRRNKFKDPPTKSLESNIDEEEMQRDLCGTQPPKRLKAKLNEKPNSDPHKP